MGPVVVSCAVVVAGLWLILDEHEVTVAATFGWLLLLVGLVLLPVNLLLRRYGYSPPRRRR